MRRVLVTGASGFIGGHLIASLAARPEWKVVGSSRRLQQKNTSFLPVQADETTTREQWCDLLSGCKYVVHTAARAHILKKTASQDEARFHQVNVGMSENLVQAAMDAGVKRFVFLSTIGVHGQSGGQPITEQTVLNPASHYAHSKLAAEQALLQLTAESNMELCILRPPLVYGPGVGGNFHTLIKVANTGLPLPLGSINNQRSFINSANLVDLIHTCLLHPAAANETYVLADGEDVSTPQLLSLMGEFLDKPVRLFPFPFSVLKLAARLVGQHEKLEKISASLRVDATKVSEQLDWQPSCSMREGLRQTLSAYRRREL